MGEAYVPKPHTQGAYVTLPKPQSKGASVPMPQSQETYAPAAQMDSMPSGVQTPPSLTDQTFQPSAQSNASARVSRSRRGSFGSHNIGGRHVSHWCVLVCSLFFAEEETLPKIISPEVPAFP